MADDDTTSRSRSQSRRRRRQNQRQRQSQATSNSNTNTNMTSVEEADEELPPTQSEKQMQPFDLIKPESMNGPVTYARKQRENQSQSQNQSQGGQKPDDDKLGSSKDIMEQDGLKLRLELNLDIEIELKASIHGDLTLAIMS